MTRRTSRWLSAAAVAGVALLLPVAAGAAGSRAGIGLGARATLGAGVELAGGSGARLQAVSGSAVQAGARLGVRGASTALAAAKGGSTAGGGDPTGGKVVVTWGADLTAGEKAALAALLSVPEGAVELTVTNAEEHRLLGAHFDARTIGSRAISSVLVRPAPSGSGIRVTTRHITTVTPAMYENALATAGIRDAEVTVAAPFDVSGTAALAGILKAYETAAGTALAPERKAVAPAEVAQTIRLARAVGNPDLAAAFMTRLKERMAQHPSNSPESIRRLIRSVAADLGVRLSDEMVDELVVLVQKMKAANVDWQGVHDQLAKARAELHAFLGTDTPLLRAWVDRIYGWLTQFLTLVRQWLA